LSRWSAVASPERSDLVPEIPDQDEQGLDAPLVIRGDLDIITILTALDHLVREDARPASESTRRAGRNLLQRVGWRGSDGRYRIVAGIPDQPDGIADDSRDLPNVIRAAQRVRDYIRATGDGLYDVQAGAPLYGRDLEVICRAVIAAGERVASENLPLDKEPRQIWRRPRIGILKR
jgi:hypothetical protein